LTPIKAPHAKIRDGLADPGVVCRLRRLSNLAGHWSAE
jgi:hypothetical protein